MLLEEVVFAVLTCEVATVLLLIAPLPHAQRRGIARSFESWGALLARPAKYLSAGMVVCLLVAMRELTKLDRNAGDVGMLVYEAKLYRAQRNVGLCVASVLLAAIVARLVLLLKEVSALTATKEALTKQATGASAAYTAVVEERDALKAAADGKRGDAAPGAGAAAKSAADEESELAAAQETVATLRERCSKLLDERDAATASAEAMKKQAAGLSAEYARLLAQKESLEHKLEDYELVLGDEVKKSK